MGKILTMILLALFGNFQVEFGTVLNDAGDGRLHNGEPYYNYISYSNVDGAETGDEIMSVFAMGNSGEPDDIIKRYDFILR